MESAGVFQTACVEIEGGIDTGVGSRAGEEETDRVEASAAADIEDVGTADKAGDESGPVDVFVLDGGLEERER